MTKTTRAIFEKALKLPLETRADLAELLLNSILEDDRSERRKIDKAWAKEAKDRFDAYVRGEMQAHPMGNVIKVLKKGGRAQIASNA